MLPTSTSDRPSRALEFFTELLHTEGQPMPGRILDIACGNGRNAVSLAARGVDVIAFDHSHVALRMFADVVNQRSLSDRVRIVRASMMEDLPFASSAFDGALCLTAIENLTTDEQLEHFVGELERVLRPHSLLLLYKLTQEDGFYGPRITRTDGRALTFSEDIGLQQRIYSREEIERLFTPRFRIVKARPFHFTDERGGTAYRRSLEALVLRGGRPSAPRP